MADDGQRTQVPLTAEERRRVRRLPPFMMAIMVGVGLGGVAISLLTHDHRDASVAILVFSLVLIAIAVIAGLFMRVLYATPIYSEVLRWPWSQRRKVAKALRRGEQLSDDDLPVARAMVALTRRQRWLPWLYLGLASVWGIDAVIERRSLVLHLALAVGYCLGVVLAIRNRRKVLRNWESQHRPTPHDGRRFDGRFD